MLPYTSSEFAIKNKRRKMEDRHVVIHDLNQKLNLKDMPPHSYYAVFDGHAGVDAAEFAAEKLHVNLASHVDFLTDTKRAIKETFKLTDKQFCEKTDNEGGRSGCTAIVALIREKTLYIAWLGDSQALLLSKGRPVELMIPHKPDRPDERQRIEQLGGFVCHLGTWRVNGTLAVSRALGDYDFKPYVSCEPEINVFSLDGSEDFLILACDGLWDTVTPDDAVTIVYRHLLEGSVDVAADTIAEKLVHQSKQQGSDDNITVVAVFLRSVSEILADVNENGFLMSQEKNEKEIFNFQGRNIPERPKNLQNISAFPSLCVDSSESETVSQELLVLSELPTPPIDDIDTSNLRDEAYHISCSGAVSDKTEHIPPMSSDQDTIQPVNTSDSNDFQLHEVEACLQFTSRPDILKKGTPEEISEAVNIASGVVSSTVEAAIKGMSMPNTHPESTVPYSTSVSNQLYEKDESTHVENALSDVLVMGSTEDSPGNHLQMGKTESEAVKNQPSEKLVVDQLVDLSSVVVGAIIEVPNTIQALSQSSQSEHQKSDMVVGTNEIPEKELLIDQNPDANCFKPDVEQVKENVMSCLVSEGDICVGEKVTVGVENNNLLNLSSTNDLKSVEPFKVPVQDGLHEIVVVSNSENSTTDDLHTSIIAVDLQAVPDGVPEAEGVCEDIDSDSEKDGGWSYVKGVGNEELLDQKPLKHEIEDDKQASHVETLAPLPPEVKNKELAKTKKDVAAKPKLLASVSQSAKSSESKPKKPSAPSGPVKTSETVKRNMLSPMKAPNNKPKTSLSVENSTKISDNKPKSAANSVKKSDSKPKIASMVGSSAKTSESRPKAPNVVEPKKTVDSNRKITSAKLPNAAPKPLSDKRTVRTISSRGTLSVATSSAKDSGVEKTSSTLKTAVKRSVPQTGSLTLPHQPRSSEAAKTASNKPQQPPKSTSAARVALTKQSPVQPAVGKSLNTGTHQKTESSMTASSKLVSSKSSVTKVSVTSSLSCSKPAVAKTTRVTGPRKLDNKEMKDIANKYEKQMLEQSTCANSRRAPVAAVVKKTQTLGKVSSTASNKTVLNSTSNRMVQTKSVSTTQQMKTSSNVKTNKPTRTNAGVVANGKAQSQKLSANSEMDEKSSFATKEKTDITPNDNKEILKSNNDTVISESVCLESKTDVVIQKMEELCLEASNIAEAVKTEDSSVDSKVSQNGEVSDAMSECCETSKIANIQSNLLNHVSDKESNIEQSLNADPVNESIPANV